MLDIPPIFLLLALLPMLKPILRIVLRSIFRSIASSGRLPRSFRSTVFVIDGDTVIANRGRERIRIWGIDAPEIGQSQGQASKAFLRKATEGHQILIKPIEHDRYGRIVAQLVRISDQADIGQLCVSHGMALAETRYTRRYAGDQRRARRMNIGLWTLGGIENPRAWRATNQRN